jgi:hypothetical protein
MAGKTRQPVSVPGSHSGRAGRSSGFFSLIGPGLGAERPMQNSWLLGATLVSATLVGTVFLDK